jgi:hypothetical protein
VQLNNLSIAPTKDSSTESWTLSSSGIKAALWTLHRYRT